MMQSQDFRGRASGNASIPLDKRSEEHYPPERFWCRLQVVGDCWEWGMARLPSGYGVPIFGRGNHLRAHRIAWALTHGPIPEGMWVLHRCDNPPCCNPAHLFLGTRQDNVDDMCGKRRHSWGEKSGLASLTNAQALAIRIELAEGKTQREIAKRYGVSQSTVSRVGMGRTYAHVNEGAA